MEEAPRPAEQTDPAQAAARARERARGLFDRIAPVLRDVSAASEQHPVLRTTRDALVERAGELVQRADDALGRITAIEGTVVDEAAAPATRDAAAAANAATSPAPAPAAAASETGEPTTHWTRQRVARMARAAAVEAVRPATPAPLLTRTRVGAIAVAALLLALLLRGRRR